MVEHKGLVIFSLWYLFIALNYYLGWLPVSEQVQGPRGSSAGSASRSVSQAQPTSSKVPSQRKLSKPPSLPTLSKPIASPKPSIAKIKGPAPPVTAATLPTSDKEKESSGKKCQKCGRKRFPAPELPTQLIQPQSTRPVPASVSSNTNCCPPEPATTAGASCGGKCQKCKKKQSVPELATKQSKSQLSKPVPASSSSALANCAPCENSKDATRTSMCQKCGKPRPSSCCK